MPRVSVGMPVYNGEEFIHQAIDSILQQTFEDLELVISDNASTDKSEQICREYAAKDKRVRYIRNEKNIGASDNYNAVYLNSDSEYFKWVSCSDICEEHFLEKCIEVLDADPSVILSYPKTVLFEKTIEDGQVFVDNMHIMDDNACVRYQQFMDRVQLNNAMNGVLRSKALKHSALIKPFFSSDTALMAELALYGKFYEVDGSYYYRRMDEKTATHLKSADEVLKHYDPDMKNLMLFQEWKLQYEYFTAIRRAPITAAEKKCVYRYFFKQLRWHRNELIGDFAEMFKKYYQKMTA
jgi:glycosyltransferase involved in cell wall biosynthesis